MVVFLFLKTEMHTITALPRLGGVPKREPTK